MQVHEVEANARLKVSVNLVHLHLVSYVDDLDITEMGLFDRLIDRLVLLDPVPEVALSVLSGHMRIVGIPGRDLEGHIGSDHGRIVTATFQEQND
jgi:hypothetical protein